MKHFRWLGLLLLLLVTTAAAAEQETMTSPAAAEQETMTPQALPLAVFDNMQQTLPPVIEGAEVTHSFVVRNKGEAPLSIERVRTG